MLVEQETVAEFDSRHVKARGMPPIADRQAFIVLHADGACRSLEHGGMFREPPDDPIHRQRAVIRYFKLAFRQADDECQRTKANLLNHGLSALAQKTCGPAVPDGEMTRIKQLAAHRDQLRQCLPRAESALERLTDTPERRQHEAIDQRDRRIVEQQVELLKSL